MKRLGLLLWCAPVLVWATGKAPGDYAYTQTLQVAGGAAHYELMLPAEVLAVLTRKDWGDLRVFDRDGKPQPHAWRPEPPAAELAAKTGDLRIFPLPERALATGSALSIDLQNGQTRVRIRGAAPTRQAETTAAYLLDAREFPEPIAALALDWREPRVYQGRVTVEASDDLLAWTTLVSSAPLLRTEMAGQSLGRQQIEWSPRQAKYLRLTWPKGEPPLALTSARAHAATSRGESPRQWQTAKFLKAGEKAGEFVYESPGALPVDRLRVVFDAGNHTLPAEILTREREDEPWRRVTQSVFYRLVQGNESWQNPDVIIHRSQRRYWLLRTDRRLAVEDPPALALGWLPPRLVFLAQGVAPYQLAFGARDAANAALPIATLIPDWDRRREDRLAIATLGERQSAGGEARLASEFEWKRLALWAVLGAGVLLLAVLAWGLLRETEKK